MILRDRLSNELKKELGVVYMKWYLEVLRKYAVFNGRSRRAEYWYFALFNIIVSIILTFIDVLTGSFNAEAGVGLLGCVYSLAVLVPSIAVSFRRLHDTGRSAWWLLIVFIPLAGFIILFVFMLLESEAGDNEYGPYPKTSIV